jgi:hypothetical protein
MRGYRKESGMEPGLQIQLIWKDNDMVEARLSAWNGEFGGKADLYHSHGLFAELAQALEGFPRSAADHREFALGELAAKGCGGALLRLRTVDLAGHSAIALTMMTGTRHGANQTVDLHARVEAAAIDDFVGELRRIENEISPTASLRFAL